MKLQRSRMFSLGFLIIASIFLLSCKPKALVPFTSPPASPPWHPTNRLAAPPPAQSLTPKPAPLPAGKVGGTFVIAIPSEPDTLDPHKTGSPASEMILAFTGASLVIRAPDGSYQPYLAEWWNISADRLAWDFTLRRDVRFHDGTPLTAQDYALTFERALAPETDSPVAGPSLGPINSIEVLDEFTLRLTLAEPYFPILEALSNPAFMQPLSQAALDTLGKEFSRNPIGVGPYQVAEWVPGDKVTLQRNPDFSWGPSYTSGGPYYFDFIEFRILPETSAILTGLEMNELDYAALKPDEIQGYDLQSNYQVFEVLHQGLRPYLTLNVSKPPFDDLRVRKALNLMVDREELLQGLVKGQGILQNGPLSRSQIGYWAGIEEIGGETELDQARLLMAEAGYTPGADGLLEKDGQPFRLPIYTFPIESWIRTAELIQEQVRRYGISLEIIQEEQENLIARLVDGDYQMATMSITHPEADILYLMFHSSNIGILNLSHYADPVADELLSLSRIETNPEKRQAVVSAAQQHIVERAVIVPLFTPVDHYIVLSNRVKGFTYSPGTQVLYLENAYIDR